MTISAIQSNQTELLVLHPADSREVPESTRFDVRYLIVRQSADSKKGVSSFLIAPIVNGSVDSHGSQGFQVDEVVSSDYFNVVEMQVPIK